MDNNSLPYPRNDKHAIIAFAKHLKGLSLRVACGEQILRHGYTGKGRFGQLLEKFYFQYAPNATAAPDFPEAGLELKSSPLKQLKNGEYRAKERLVLNMINYIKLVNERFEASAFWTKNNHLLLVFYLHEVDVSVLDYVVKLVDEWRFPSDDLAVIKQDWETIKAKVAAGKAHELSEGDTFYLGACTKGANAQSTRRQPMNNTPAKQRAYALKQGYINHIIASLGAQEAETYGKRLSQPIIGDGQNIAQTIITRLQAFYGQSAEEILEHLGTNVNLAAKDGYARLTKAMLGASPDTEIAEFEKAEIVIKTVRLEENDMPKESLSFASFAYTQLVKESWQASSFRHMLERKFLFVFFKRQNHHIVLKKAALWNMPYEDINEAKQVWQQTREIVASGNIVRYIKGGSRYTNFPKKADNRVSHVRPHAQNAADTYPLPVADQETGARAYTKHCFWLNNTYVKEEIYLKI